MLQNYTALLKELQKHDFKNLAKLSTNPKEKRKLLAFAHLKDGKSVKEAANAVSVTEQIVYIWLGIFEKEGLKGPKKRACYRVKELQKHDFKSLAKLSTNPKEKKKLLAFAHLKNGKSVQETADTVNVDVNSVYYWLSKFKKEGLEGLKERDDVASELQKHDFKGLAELLIHSREKKRLLAFAYLKDGKSIQEVADTVRVDRRSIHDWLSKFKKGGLKGLREKGGGESVYSASYLQKYDFKSLAEISTNPREKRRLLAFAHLKDGKSIQEVADAVGVNRSSIRDWRSKFKKEGLEGLKEREDSASELQKHDFKILAELSMSSREKKRLLAFAHLKDGKSVQEAADAVKVHALTVYDWLRKFKKEGLEGLREA